MKLSEKQEAKLCWGEPTTVNRGPLRKDQWRLLRLLRTEVRDAHQINIVHPVWEDRDKGRAFLAYGYHISTEVHIS